MRTWIAALAVLVVAAASSAAPNATIQTGTGAWKKGGKLVPPDFGTDATASSSSIHANAGTVSGKITKKERSSAAFKGTMDFTLSAESHMRIDSDIALFLEKAHFTYKYRLFRGRKSVQLPGGIVWTQKTPGQEVNFNWFQDFPGLKAGSYRVRYSYKISRSKNGAWDQHSQNAKPFTLTVSEQM